MINYASDIKAARMEVVARALDGGALLLLDAAGATLAEVRLQSPSGGVFASLLHLAGAPFIAAATASGELVGAKFVRADGSLVMQGMTVDVEGADIVVDNRSVVKGNLIKIDSVDLRHA